MVRMRWWNSARRSRLASGITNTPHFGNPTADLNSSNFGKVTGTLATANASRGGSGGKREWLFGRKIIF